MNARSLVVTIAALALGSQCLAQEPNFGDLGVTETSTYHRESTVRPADIDTEAFDALCTESRELLDGIFGHYREIYLGCNEIYRESTGRDSYGHWDKDRFSASKLQASELRLKASRLKGKLARLANFFEDLSIEDKKAYETLLERHASVLRLFTEYNTLVEWTRNLELDYDTMLPFDEKDFEILDRDEFRSFPLPNLPLLQIVQTVAITDREEIEGRDGAPLIHESQTLGTSRTVLRRVVAPASVTALFDECVALADVADEDRSKMTALADREGDAGLIRFRGTLDDFEKNVKPLAVDFALALTRMKGARNALFALLEGSDLYEGDANLRARWQELDARFQDLAKWGDATKIEWDALAKAERLLPIFPTAKFASTDIFGGHAPSGSGTRGTVVTGSVIPLQDEISVNDAFILVKGVTGYQDREDMCYKVIPRVRGLTAKNLTDLASWIQSDSREEKVINFGLQYLNR